MVFDLSQLDFCFISSEVLDFTHLDVVQLTASPVSAECGKIGDLSLQVLLTREVFVFLCTGHWTGIEDSRINPPADRALVTTLIMITGTIS